MTQDQVLRLLEKSKKPLNTKEIREKLGVRSVDKNLVVLRKHNEIKWIWKVIETKNGGGMGERAVIHYYV